MLVLEQGTLSNFSCGQRMAVVFVGMTLLQVALLALLTMRLGYSSERMYGYGFGYNSTYRIETLNETPFFSRRRLIGFAIWSAIVATVAIVCMLSRTETMIGMDSNVIVEPSCSGLFPPSSSLPWQSRPFGSFRRSLPGFFVPNDFTANRTPDRTTTLRFRSPTGLAVSISSWLGARTPRIS